MTAAHRFLSPEWIAAVALIRDDYRDHLAPTEVEIRANVTVTDAPFVDPIIHGHVDTTGGALTLDEGHLADGDFTIEMPYEIAEQIFVDRDPQAMIGILVGGRVKLTGDSTKILGLAGMAAPPDAASESAAIAREVMVRIDAVTLRADGA